MADNQSTPESADLQPVVQPIECWPYPVDAADIVASVVYVGTPLAKSRPRFGRGGRVYTPQTTKVYEANIKALLLHAVGLGNVDAESCFALRCRFYRHDRQRIDCDNLMKAISDAANKAVWKDDSQVVEIMGRLTLADSKPRVEVLIYRILDPSPLPKCPTCGKAVVVSPSRPRVYCSTKCFNAPKKMLVSCAACDVEFLLRKCEVERRRANSGGSVYCSRSCAKKAFHAKALHVKKEKKYTTYPCPTCDGRMTHKHYTQCRACKTAASTGTKRYKD